jgi:NAD(P)-dependent dehydrogenase (short-subunit alcohol dehydrogenase family)
LAGSDFDAWTDSFTTMVLGPFRVVQAFLGNLTKPTPSKIVTVTTQLASSTWPLGGSYGYASAKAAVNRVMQILAIDLNDTNISVGLVHPGWVKTDLGGPDADITPQASASGVRRVIEDLKKVDSGKFFKWTGELHPL